MIWDKKRKRVSEEERGRKEPIVPEPPQNTDGKPPRLQSVKRPKKTKADLHKHHGRIS